MAAARRRASAARVLALAAAAGVFAVAAPALAQLPPLPSAAGSGLGSGLGGGQSRGLSFQPGVRTTLTISDNALQEPSGSESAGWKADISPYITATMSTPRAQASLNYSMHALYRAAGGEHSSSLRHGLSASGNALLAGDWFGIQGSATTSYVNTSPFGVLSPDPISSATNTSRVSTARLTPYLVGRLGTFADYRADYTLTRTNTSSAVADVVSSGSQSAGLTVVSGPQFRAWGWSLSSRALRRDYRNGLELSGTSTSINVHYLVTPELRVGASANHVYNEDPNRPRSETTGWGKGLSLDWSPNPRTTLRLSTIDQYYGNSTTVALSHRAQRWTFGLNYSKGVLNSQDGGILLFNPLSLISGSAFDATLNAVFQQLVAEGVITNEDILASGILNDSLVKSNTLSATMGYRLPRASIGLTAFRSVREALLDSSLFVTPGNPLVISSFTQYVSRGLSLNVAMPLSARTSLAFGGSVRENESLVNTDAARLSSLNATISTRFDARTTGSLGYRHTVQSSAQGGRGYNENAIIGTLDLRF